VLIAQHEGFRATAYRDTRGFLTIGYGTNLDAVGAETRCAFVGLKWSELCRGDAISEMQARRLMEEDIRHIVGVAIIIVPGLLDMPRNVQLVVVDMVYNLGSDGFLKFHDMLAALHARDWKTAAAAMKDSLWYRQVGLRGKDDVRLMLDAA
jgi:lysozyme